MKRVLSTLPVTLSLSSSDTAKVASLAETFGSVLALAKVTFTRQSDPGIGPKVFLYKIEAADGRIWKQTITLDNPANPLMTFNVADPWRLTEFSAQRTLRSALLAVVGSYVDLEKLTYDYLGA